MLWRVYIERRHVHRGAKPGTIYKRTVRADKRRAALDKCLPAIRRRILPTVDEGIRYLPVYVGRKGSVTAAAGRIVPYRIVVATGQVRK